MVVWRRLEAWQPLLIHPCIAGDVLHVEVVLAGANSATCAQSSQPGLLQANCCSRRLVDAVDLVEDLVPDLLCELEPCVRIKLNQVLVSPGVDLRVIDAVAVARGLGVVQA